MKSFWDETFPVKDAPAVIYCPPLSSSYTVSACFVSKTADTGDTLKEKEMTRTVTMILRSFYWPIDSEVELYCVLNGCDYCQRDCGQTG